MLNGLEATEVKRSALDLSDRLDAEYFSKESLLISKKLHEKSARKLGELGKMAVSAFYPAATHLYAEGDIAFVRCVDCINYPVISHLQEESFERIPSYFIAEHSSIDTVGKGDLVITKVGSPCFTSIVHEHEELALSRTVMGVKEITGINAYYLLVFLRSHYGFNQLLRQRELTIQYQLTVERVKDIEIFLPSVDFQSRIEFLVRAGHENLEQSKALYAEAKSLLLDELGLNDWQPTDENITVKSFAESFRSTGRLDAEYYQPKYDQTLARLRKLKPKTILPLESLLTLITNGHTPLHHDLSIGEIPFLTAEHVSDFLINFDSDKRILTEHHQSELKRTQLQEGDILITIKGRVGNAAVVKHLPGPTNINQDVALLRLISGVHPYYVIGYLNSFIGRTFINQISTGQINPFLGLGNLRTVSIPIFEQEQMQSIGNRLQQKTDQAYETAQNSKRLLDIAKRGVEIAIEQDEAAAIRWIDEELEQ